MGVYRTRIHNNSWNVVKAIQLAGRKWVGREDGEITNDLSLLIQLFVSYLGTLGTQGNATCVGDRKGRGGGTRKFAPHSVSATLGSSSVLLDLTQSNAPRGIVGISSILPCLDGYLESFHFSSDLFTSHDYNDVQKSFTQVPLQAFS